MMHRPLPTGWLFIRNDLLYSFFHYQYCSQYQENKKFITSDFGILLAIPVFILGSLYLITAMEMSQYQGLFSASMGVFNLATSYFLSARKRWTAIFSICSSALRLALSR